MKGAAASAQLRRWRSQVLREIDVDADVALILKTIADLQKLFLFLGSDAAFAIFTLTMVPQVYAYVQTH